MPFLLFNFCFVKTPEYSCRTAARSRRLLRAFMCVAHLFSQAQRQHTVYCILHYENFSLVNFI